MTKSNSFNSKSIEPFRYTNSSLRCLLSKTTMDELQRLGTIRALSLAISYRNSGFKSIDESLLEVSPSDYETADSLARDLQACAFFKKSTYLCSDRDLDHELFNSFLKIEEINRSNNSTLRSRKNFRANSIIFSAARIISRVLGTAPSVTSFTPYFGPGASYGLASDVSTLAHKLESQPDVTMHALPLARDFLKEYPDLFNKDLKVVASNKAASVPNSYKKKRFISKEPIMNMLLQRNLGLVIKKKLKKVGIDIDHQANFHKFMVKRYWDDIATIDLSNASDSISSELVRELFIFSPDWWDMLNSTRSHSTLYNGKLYKLEKFCSQGNGFTFELETLIFWAIATAAIQEKEGNTFVSLFGDDTIVFKEYGSAVIEAYELCGFTVNTDKSYITGSFKESCGVDTFRGIDVRPTYFKDFSYGLYGFYELHNRLFDALLRSSCYQVATRHPSSALKRVRRYLIDKHSKGGPLYLGDSVLHGIPYKGTWNNGLCKLNVLSDRRLPSDFYLPNGDSLLSYALLGGHSGGILPRKSRRRVTFRSVFLHT